MDFRTDEALVRRLPLPLAQLFRHASRARTPLEQHACAVYLWEAALKLLGSVSVTEYLARGEPDAVVKERLTRLARPSLRRWLEFILRLVPLLAEHDPPFASVQEVLGGSMSVKPHGRGRARGVGMGTAPHGKGRGCGAAAAAGGLGRAQPKRRPMKT
jgi:hypothetical protein